MAFFDVTKFTSTKAKPLPVILLLDESNSMSGDKIERLNEAVIRMLNSFRKEETQASEFLVSIIGFGGDGVRHSNPAYWKDYIDHGRRRGRGTLFVDTLASIPLCEVAIALQLHGPAGYLQGKSHDELFPPRQVGLTKAQMDYINADRDLRLRTSKTHLTLLISAYAEIAAAALFGIAHL